MLRCEKCQHRDVSAKKYPCSECDFNVNDLFEQKKQTNADRIRSFSDEELAMNMMCPNENGLGEIECDKSDNCNCYACILKWLQSEVEE